MINYNWMETLHVSEEQLKSNGKKTPVLYLAAQDCTGCAMSLIVSNEPTTSSAVLDFISLEYSDTLSAASGFQIEENKEAIIEKYKGEYILCVEGSIAGCDDFLRIAGKSVKDEIIHAAKHAKAVIAIGSCSSWGGIAAAAPNPTGAVPVTEILPEETPIALVPGCPPIAEVILGTILHVHYHGKLPELDKKLRPKMFYSTSVHNSCPRKPFFLTKQFAETYNDEGFKNGWCLFKLGCKGPTTFNACETIGWNGGVCSPIGSGNACIGCSEKGFWDHRNGLSGGETKKLAENSMVRS